MKRLSFALVGVLVAVPALITSFLAEPKAQTYITYTVNTTDDRDDGSCNASHCSLREAINASNATVSDYPPIVAFNIAGAGPHSIVLASNLPMITAPIKIDGWTEPDYRNRPVIEVTGSANADCGFVFQTHNGTISGLAINGFSRCGILLQEKSINERTYVVIVGNYIGTDVTGTRAKPNRYGIEVTDAAAARIGWIEPSWGNVISGNEVGIYGRGTAVPYVDLVIDFNYIGTDRTGTVAIPNQDGIYAHQVVSMRIGHEGRNLISGNSRHGIFIEANSQAEKEVVDNFIGTDVTGKKALGNGGHGIFARQGSIIRLDSNVISGNGQAGIRLGGIAGEYGDVNGAWIARNKIGTDATGTQPIPNQVGVDISTTAKETVVKFNVIAFNREDGVRMVTEYWQHNIVQNAIFSNGGLGIDVDGNGVTPDDPDRTGDGTRTYIKYQNSPKLTGASTTASTAGGSTTVRGTLYSTPNATFEIHFYANGACDPSGHGEGERYLGQGSVATDGNGNGSFSLSVLAVTSGQFITATATNFGAQVTTNYGNTSEFSNCVVVSGDSVPPTPMPPTATLSPNALGAPILIAPANGASTGTKPTFQWQAVTGATQYRLYLSTDAGFGTLVSNQSVTTTSYTRTYSLTSGQTYYWKVRASNGSGQIGAWSEVRAFTVGSASTVPTATATIAPTSAATAGGCPTAVPSGVTARRHTPQGDPRTLLLEWEAINGACEAVQQYKVYVWRGTYHREWVFNRADLVCNATYCTATITFDAGISQIYWRVTAINAIGEGVSDNSKSYVMP